MLVGEGAEQLALGIGRILQQRERLVGVACDDDLLEALDRPVVQPYLDARFVATDRCDGGGEPHARGQRRRERLDIPARPAGDRLPAGSVAEAEHPMIVEELGHEADRERPQRRRVG